MGKRAIKRIGGNRHVQKILKIVKVFFTVVFSLLAVFLIVRAIGKGINSRTPEGGINESMYVDVNGVRQWINIYGEDLDNPVL